MMVQSYGTGASIAGFGASHAGDPHVQALWGRAERLSNSPGGFRAVYEAMLDMDAGAALSSVRAPCLIIHGAMSMFAEHGRYLADHLPDARLVAIEGVDHYPWFANADRVVSEVEEFVTGTRSAPAGERVLATLMVIDIVSSTEHAADVGDRRWRDVIDRYYALARRHVDRFRGHEVSTAGDGFLARFDGPARAVSCACAIRDAVHGLGIAVRAGLHTGEIELRDNDVMGLAVHIAARVLANAAPDEVLVSRTVKDLVVGSGIEFTDRGTHKLRGVPDEWQLYATASRH
jgi:class 3 adenylate cyclase